MKDRAAYFSRILLIGVIVGIGIYMFIFYLISSPTEDNLRRENSRLRTQFEILNRRLQVAQQVMDNIQARDDNFYRVMMQMDPLKSGQRLAGLSNEARYKELQLLSDADLIMNVVQQLDLLDRRLYSQSLSFDQLRDMAGKQEDKLAHIPAILPISLNDYTVASGYGYRRDPVYGSTKFHEGLDFAASSGTPVYATADGVVAESGWAGGYGNRIDISHGYNYVTRYGHLSRIDVEPGQNVVRGEKIGEVGSTGKSTGPHLHYEVRFKDEAQNPVNYYFLDLTPEEYSRMIELAENAGHVMD